MEGVEAWVGGGGGRVKGREGGRGGARERRAEEEQWGGVGGGGGWRVRKGWGIEEEKMRVGEETRVERTAALWGGVKVMASS